MNSKAGAYWLEHCHPPRPRPQGVEWDVFISYRSADRVWALALYDMLQQASYKVFLDQFVLTAGSTILKQLSENIGRSASGVMLWSRQAMDSDWVEREVGAMIRRKDATKASAFPFHFVAARLDAEPLPEVLEGNLYIDFSSYPDGPTGAELVRLTSGLQGAGLAPAAVDRITQFETQLREEPSTLRARVAADQFDDIVTRALQDTPAYTTSATLPALAAQLLISGKRYPEALSVLDTAQLRFPSSIRAQQLRGLALRRQGKTREAIFELEKLRDKGHNDPETLGILAAARTALWRESGKRVELERALDLYASAFRLTPTDTYSGINTASKSALLGKMDQAKSAAQSVLTSLAQRTVQRGGMPANDYWERVTEPEAMFLLEQFDQSIELYHSARVAHSTEVGSIESTAAQLSLLVELPFVPDEWRARFRAEFAEFWPAARATG